MRAHLATYASRTEADVVVARLSDAGIAAWALSDSAGGVEPQLDLIRGVRVVCEPERLAEAAEVLGVTPPDPLPPLSPERQQLVRAIGWSLSVVIVLGIVLGVVRALG